MTTRNHLTLITLLCLLAVLTTIDRGFASEPFRLRVLSYNIHHAEGVDRKLDLQRIANVILAANPDLVALQEVDQNVARTNSVDQPAELARMTKYNVAFGANIDLQGGHYGNAILSRFPLVQHKNHLLPCLDNGEQRGVLVSQIRFAENQPPLWFLATHFDHRRDDRERVASAEAINRLIEGNLTGLALLAGDLNATPASAALQRLREKWHVANQRPLPTIPVSKPDRQIDYVLWRPETRWRVVEVSVLDEAVASDHRPILAVLEVCHDESGR